MKTHVHMELDLMEFIKDFSNEDLKRLELTILQEKQFRQNLTQMDIKEQLQKELITQIDAIKLLRKKFGSHDMMLQDAKKLTDEWMVENKPKAPYSL